MFFDVQTMMMPRAIAALALMAGPALTVDGEDDKGDGGGKTADTDKAEAGQLEALKAERAQRQAVQAELATLKAEQAAAKAADAEKRGEFKELYESSSAKLVQALETITGFEAAEATRLEKATAAADEAYKGLSDEHKALVPDGLAPAARLAQIQRLAALTPAGPMGTRGAGGGKAPKVPDMTPAEAHEVAQLMKRPMMSEKAAITIVRARKKK